MDKEKKLYCRLASEFTIEELEAKIGKIDNEYESKFFDIIKESINQVGASDFINAIRVLGIHETNDKTILSVIDFDRQYLASRLFDYVDCSIDGFSAEEVWNIISGKYRLIEHYKSAYALYNAFMNIMHRTIGSIIQLGYIRLGIGSLFNRNNKIFAAFGDYGCYVWEYWDDNDGYETYDLDTIESRYQRIMDFMKARLTMLQYDVFEYRFNNGLLYGHCECKEMSTDDEQLFEEVNEVFEKNKYELFSYLVS